MSKFSFCFYAPTRKIAPDEPIGKTAEYTVRLAKNEMEGCHLVIHSECGNERFKVQFTPFTNANGDELKTDLFYEHYVECFLEDEKFGIFPDALVAIGEDTVCEVEANKNLPIYIRAKTDADSVAGDYSAKITVTDESGSEVLFTTEVKAKVWNFTLPETPACITSFGNGCHGGFREKFSVSDEEFKEIEKKLNESLLEHKLSPYFLLNEIATGEADEEMSDPRLTSFEIRYTDDDNLLLARWNRIISNPEWEKKAHFYVVDEPQTMEHVERIIKTSDRLKRLCPGYKYVLPSNLPVLREDPKIDIIDDIYKDRVNILCPLSLFFADPDYLSKLHKYKSEGYGLWWYVCCAPLDEYCNFTVNEEGIRHRLLLWQQKSLNVDGLLYWETAYWACVNPWEDVMTVPWTNSLAFGDGMLYYNGDDGPVPSLRLELISAGIDDFEYLTIAEKLFGREYVDEKISKLTTGLTEYTLCDEELASVRAQIGDDIEKAING
ncbi:MAG: DUF4091 domain-containing protein [Acutalibacteraceae bacterium]